MSAPRDPPPLVSPRRVSRETPLEPAAIVHPAGDPLMRRLARELADAIGRHGRPKPVCVADTELMPERGRPLPKAYRKRTLILLGNLNTNRALQPLYANYLCSTDAAYPGGDGYDLRTIVNPYGTGAHVVLAGGSTPRGVERAVGRLLAAIARAGRGPLPPLLEVELAPALAAQLAAWPYTPLDDSPELQALRNRGLMFYTEPIRVIGAYTLMWSWTADARYARIAVDALRRLNATMKSGYGDWHYLAERFLRALPLLTAGGWLTDEDIARTDELLVLTALGNQAEWWRMRAGRPPLGHRHHGKGTYEFLLLARYLRDQTNPSDALRSLCDRWIAECHAFLDALALACIDDQDDESTLNNLATLYRYALGEERHEFFTSGNARRVAERCLALHDNNGNGAGQGGYGESQGMYLQQEATEQVACCAFYYGDARLKWILQQLPNLDVAQRYMFLRYAPVFLQKYDTGPELRPVAPTAIQGVTCLPVTDHQFALSNRPPEHVEPAGHMVNAPETWQLPEGIGLNRLPQSDGFDKLVLRAGYERADAYLLVQGYQGGFRWQGHMQAANCIVRFYQAGHVWLVQNTSRHSVYDKNGVLVSDGAGEARLPPIAERVAVADFPALAVTVTRVAACAGADWTRHLFWARAADCFVAIDRVDFRADGEYALVCTWRTPAHATAEGRQWRSAQGGHRFTLAAGAAYDQAATVDTDQGACAPHVLRQRRSGAWRAGGCAAFQNLFHVRGLDEAAALDLRRLDETTAVVRRDDRNIAWCAAGLVPGQAWLPEADAQAAAAWIEAHALSLAGATRLSLPFAGCRVESDRPVHVRIDLVAAAITLQPDAREAVPAEVGVECGKSLHHLTLAQPVILPLSADRCALVARTVAAWIEGLAPAEMPPPPRPPAPPPGGRTRWRFDAGTRVPRVDRDVRITADPLPVNGSPDEMLDPVMPDGYSRETWIQWPRAEAYRMTLALPAPRRVAGLTILGDCIDDPTLRTFNPLPDGIAVEAEAPDGSRHACPVVPAPDRRYKRYRDAENRLQVRTAAVDRDVVALHLRFPAPPDGRPFVLHRLEVLAADAVAPAIVHACVADLDGDGEAEIVCVNARQELVVVGADGRERWRETLPAPATHVSAQPIEPQGPPVLCVGVLGGDLRLYQPGGELRTVLAVARDFQARRDCLQGWYNATHSIGIWRRDANGRGCLVLGGYAILVFLDADGAIVGHSFSDGPWNHDILVAADSRPDRGDLYVRCGWNHGIQYYEAVPGPGPSGEVFHLGGFNQPMFRMLRRVIPFLNGRSLAAAWVNVEALPEGAMFFATELGAGVLSVSRKDWHWKLEGSLSLNAASVDALAGRPVALLGGMDGFLLAVDLETGRVVRRRQFHAPVLGVAPAGGGRLLVATPAGVQALDADWVPVAAQPAAVARMLPAGDDRVLVVTTDQALALLDFPAS